MINNNEEKKILTDEELEAVINAAEEESKDVENDMRRIKEEVQVNPDAELEKATVTHGINENPDVAFATGLMEITDKDIFSIAEDEAPSEDTVISYEAITKTSAGSDLTEEEVYRLLNVIDSFRKDNTINVYPLLPEKIQKTVREIAMANGIPASRYGQIARYVLEEFISDAGFEQAFVDIQKSLDEALNIPSVVDMYSEHMREVMEVKIPEMSEKIREEDPEKADLLLKIKEVFTNAYTFSYAKEMYEANSRVRKTVRRCDDRELKLAIRNFNARNKDTKFIMNDANELPVVLVDILNTQPNAVKESCITEGKEIPERYQKIIDMNLTPEDIVKFSIFLFNSCNTLNANAIVDASYMYYMLKNIITLKHTNEAKTEFAAELINNICDTISFIRNKEAEFYAEHMDESKPRKKPGKKNSNRK